jgi:hypothetical protein
MRCIATKTTTTLALVLAALAAAAADIATTEVFYDSQAIRPGNLNGIIGKAAVSGAFITGKTSADTATTNDALVFYKATASDLRQISVTNLWASLWNISTNSRKYWPQTYTSPLISLSTLIAATYPRTNLTHGLGGKPQFVRWKLVCVQADGAHVAGDECPAQWGRAYAMGKNSSGYEYGVLGVGGASSTNVFYGAFTKGHDGNAALSRWIAGAGALASITPANWRLKCYATYYPQ